MPLKACTYNIHSCVGTDGRRDAGRIAAVLDEIGADIIGLQEVDDRHADVEGGQFAYLLGATGFHVAAGPTLRSERGAYGNLLLSRWPLYAVQRVDLTVPGRYPRCAIDARLQVDGRTVRVIAAHLGLLPDEQFRQVRMLSALVRADPDVPTLVMGDFNIWGPARPLFRRLGAKGARKTALPSFPAWAPTVALDRVWALPVHLIRERRVHRTALSVRASDHLPVVARVELAPATALDLPSREAAASL